jgi:ketosteroid isomerase-like protein
MQIRSDSRTARSSQTLGRDTADAVASEREQLIRREFERWNARERDINPEVVHPEMVIHSAMTNATYEGRDGVRRWMAEIDEQFEEWRLSIDQLKDLSDDRVLVLGPVHFQGRASGIEFDQPVGWLLTFAGTQVTEMKIFSEHDAAVEAADTS